MLSSGRGSDGYQATGHADDTGAVALRPVAAEALLSVGETSTGSATEQAVG